MRASVRAGARAFDSLFEGSVAEMYVDVLGIVTCGIGNRIDYGSPDPARSLGWVRRSDGQPASQSEIVSEWHAVKDGKLAWYHGRPPRPIYLSEPALSALFFQKLDANEQILAKRWRNWDQFPADAQLGCHSDGWAAGPLWKAPALDRDAGVLDFQRFAGPPGDANTDPFCRGDAWLNDDGNPGLRPRNLANKTLFWNAAVVLNDGRDPDVLYYPVELDG
jgi:hypothetical protein